MTNKSFHKTNTAEDEAVRLMILYKCTDDEYIHRIATIYPTRAVLLVGNIYATKYNKVTQQDTQI